MNIKNITADDLRRMNGKEGLVLQGCGGDPQEWLDGINGLFTGEGILRNGSKFENIAVFQNGGLTNILFPFEDGMELDIGRLAMWRLCSHEQFGGTWLSDYVPNRLGGFIYNMLTASATVDGNAVQMREDNGSANAEALLKMVNNPGFDLPDTGDNGTMMLSIIGIVIMAGAALVIFMATRKKPDTDRK